MLYFFRLLLLLINIDQETVLNWFGVKVENPNTKNLFSQQLENDPVNISNIEIKSSTALSIETLKLILEGLWQRVQDGLTLADIDNLLFFILFLRFLILAVRYNLKTSFYITCIGFVAGYLWHKHLVDLIAMYKNILITVPYFKKFAMYGGTKSVRFSRISNLGDEKSVVNVGWNNPGQLIYDAFTKGIVNIDSETGIKYYIDPVSMIISNLKEPEKSKVIPVYYKIYHIIIPKLFETCSYLWSTFSGIATYAVITRIGRRYCPYLVRWHWTFLILLGFVEQVFMVFVHRVFFFQYLVVLPQIPTKILNNSKNLELILQLHFLQNFLPFLILLHVSLIFLGLFHAVCGQYFYFPFFVENTELHVGPRPKNSIYSGGNTAWQDKKQKNIQRVFPKLWFGWFGSGKTVNLPILKSLKKLIRKILEKLKIK